MFNVIPSNGAFFDNLNVIHLCLDMFNTHSNIIVYLDAVSKIYAPHSAAGTNPAPDEIPALVNLQELSRPTREDWEAMIAEYHSNMSPNKSRGKRMHSGVKNECSVKSVVERWRKKVKVSEAALAQHISGKYANDAPPGNTY